MADVLRIDVLIAGGGPCGLMLANELGRRGVACLPRQHCQQHQYDQDDTHYQSSLTARIGPPDSA